jgi:hypothetical protein
MLTPTADELKTALLRYERALRHIIEIGYAGHPDGRETRLEMITRIATQALEHKDAK